MTPERRTERLYKATYTSREPCNQRREDSNQRREDSNQRREDSHQRQRRLRLQRSHQRQEDVGKGRFRLKDAQGNTLKTAINCHRLKIWHDPKEAKLNQSKRMREGSSQDDSIPEKRKRSEDDTQRAGTTKKDNRSDNSSKVGGYLL